MEWKNNQAIYLQVIELFKKGIILGEFKSKEKIPSVREYAQKLGINPNTVVKVYDILVQEGLIEAQSTNGYYITDNLEVLKPLKPSFASAYCKEFLSQMQGIGYSKEEALKLLKEEK